MNNSQKNLAKTINSNKGINQKRFVKATGILLLAIFLIGNLPILNVSAAGTYSGIVFKDFNGDGTYDTAGGVSSPAIDIPVQNVTVTLYDAGGTARGTANTGSNGVFSIVSSGTGPYRVEFTNIPAGLQPSARSVDSVDGGTGTDAGSTVQFVANGGDTNVNLALNVPDDYCQNNPLICTTAMTYGNNNSYAALTFPMSYSSERDGNTNGTTTDTNGLLTYSPARPAPTTLANSTQIGANYGIAYNKNTSTIYTSSFLKRKSPSGSTTNETTGGIYQMSPTGAFSPSLYVDLNTVFGAGTTGANPHPRSTTTWVNDTSTRDLVGKRGFGDLDISPDNSTLYTVNLADRRLYAIPTSGTLDNTTIQSYAIPTTGIATSTGRTCNANDVRPFGLGFDSQGQLYVGGVCSAETGANILDLRMYVWRFTGGTFTLVFNADNAYNWNAWTTPTTQDVGGYYQQPILSDILFDGNDMVLGFRDRLGDQLTADGVAFNASPWGRGNGNTARACWNGTIWNRENNGTCGSITTAGANTNQGYGNGEYYYQDSSGDTSNESGLGSLAKVPGVPEIMSTSYDAVNYYTNGTEVNNNFGSAGIQRYNNANGQNVGNYDVYLANTEVSQFNFWKTNGLGDIEALCDRAPIEIGNRVWRDTITNNGVQDPGEIGIANVTVRLYDAANTLIATAVTDANGEYYFTSGTAADGDITNNVGIVNGQITPNTNYQVRFDLPANYGVGGPLTGLLMTTRDQTTQAGFDDGSDSDAVLVTNPTTSPAGTFPVIPVTTGAAGNNTHNLDVGFTSATTYSIGNRVWFDTDNDGQIDANEVGIDNVSVSLFLDANGDGNPDTPGTPVATQNTASGGYYRFDTLAANNYVVRINPSNFANAAVLSGYANTAGSSNADTDSTSVAGQNGENGINPSGAANTVQTNGILSGSIALGAPGEPVSETDVLGTTQGSIDPAANLTIDFGFYRLNLSGTVWRDTGAGANNNNGRLDTGETGISSVIVRLYDSANVEIPVGRDGILGTADDAVGGMNTDSSGNYNFQGLPAGTYRVVVSPNGATSSTPTSTTPDDNINSNDDGTPQTSGAFTGRITSGLVALTPGNAGALSNNTINNANGSTSNPTIDFGLIIAPTAVQLESFDAFADMNGSVTLKWSTGSEANNLGFNVYRETNGKRERLNSSPIAGSALRTDANLQANGDSYSWTDARAEANAVYYLEDIDLDGSTNLYGAVSAKMQFSRTAQVQQSKLLSDLAESAAPIQTDSAETAKVAPKSGNKSVQDKIAAQNGVKIAVKRDGWYRVTAEQLHAAGFEVNSNTANWQMSVNGEEVPFTLNADHSVEFFGRGLDTISTDKQIYYLTVGSGKGQRIGEIKGGTAGETADAVSFRNVAVRRDRGVYASAILNGEAENWFGAVVSGNAQTAQDLVIYNPDANGGNAHLSVKLQGLTNSEHLVSVRFNDLDLGAVDYSNRENRSFEFEIPMNVVQTGTNRITLQAVGAGSDVSVVDSISLNYARLYKAENDRLRFTVPAGQTVRVGGFSSQEFDVYEIRGGKISNRIAVETEKMNETSGFSLAAANSSRDFLAVGKLQAEQAVLVENDYASDWRNSSNKADFVIITPNAFRASAEKLAQMRQAQGLKTEVVAVEDLYDEFTFGAQSPVAVQEFLRTATSKWTIKPQYALLFGDSSYDSRNYLGGTNRNLVPTKLIDTENLETASDASLADFNNDGIEDIALGRLPAVNQTEAEAMISKIQRYERRPAREEGSNLFVSDANFENYSNALRDLLPANVGSTVLNRTGTTDSEMRQSLLEKLNLGATVVTYSGHGSNTLLTNGNVFRNADALNLNNQKLSFFMLMSCLNGFTHNASADSLAESLVKSNNGAIAVWASSGTTNADGQAQLSRAATDLLFNSSKPLRIGAIIRTAKQATADRDIRTTWQFIGDPTVFIR